MTDDPCEVLHLLLQAELDSELDAAGAASLAAHLTACPACAALRHELGTQSASLREGLSRFAAPPALRRAVAAQHPARPWRAFPLPWRHGLSFGAGAAVAAAVALAVLPPAGGRVPELVAAHIRALQPGHLLDVASTDQHTVKPWFAGRLDYAPPVMDFAAAGFPLIGGRLDYLDGRPVAALIYRRDRHLIDVFVWPAGRPVANPSAAGYNVLAWRQNGMEFRAVSDLNAADLMTFARMWGSAN